MGSGDQLFLQDLKECLGPRLIQHKRRLAPVVEDTISSNDPVHYQFPNSTSLPRNCDYGTLPSTFQEDYESIESTHTSVTRLSKRLSRRDSMLSRRDSGCLLEMRR